MLTVFIATRNGARTLPRVLTAYAELQAPAGGWKLVIIDNGSDDGTAAVAASFADRLPLVVLSEPRPGKNRALNRGLRELAGDLAVFSDDDTLPERDWLVQLRAAADRQPECGIFCGPILPSWEVPPPDWVREWVRPAPVYCVSDVTRAEGPCEASAAWGPNMAIRAEWFRKGYRFDERLGPNGTATYAMGSETELTLRLAIAEQVRAWHCRQARVQHIIRPWQLSRAWVLRRAFRFGRSVRREFVQYARAGRPYTQCDASTICTRLWRHLVDLAQAWRAADARRAFEARWQLHLWAGCLYEALRSGYEPQGPIDDGGAYA